jgi:hypothetical protein
MVSMMDRSQRCAARIFGITYLPGFAIIMVAFSRFYAPYLVWGNGEETARHFIGHDSAVRLYLAGAFLHGLAMLLLLTALYVILRPVNRLVALFATFSKLIYVVFWFMVQMEVFGALRLLAGGASLRSFGPDGLIALAGAQLDSSRDAYYIGLVFTGLGSALFAWAFFQSRYIPRILALWGVLASLYEGFCGFAYLFHPRFGAVLSPDSYELPAMTFELLLCAWLLVRGFRSSKPALANRQPV